MPSTITGRVGAIESAKAGFREIPIASGQTGDVRASSLGLEPVSIALDESDERKQTPHWVHSAAATAVAATLFACFHAHAQVTYSVTPLGSLGGNVTQATDINNAGQVVGWSRTASGQTHAFIWTTGTGMQDIGPCAGGKLAINNLGHVVGQGTDSRPFLWTPQGSQFLPTLGGSYSYPNDINDLDQVVGAGPIQTCTTDINGVTTCVDGPVRAWLWSPNGGLQDLGTLASTTAQARNSSANGINNLGVVVGSTNVDAIWCNYFGCRQRTDAFRWTSGGGMVDIGFLPQGVSGASANAINDAGQIVGGSSVDADGQFQHAFLLNPGDVMQDIHAYTFCGNTSYALAINSSGIVVGVKGGSISCGDDRPFLYSGTLMIDLSNPMGGVATPPSGIAINDLGDMAASGYNYTSGPQYAYFITPCRSVSLQASPSPSSACPTGPATFSITASGTGPFTYQWKINDPQTGAPRVITEGVNLDLSGNALFTAQGSDTPTIELFPGDHSSDSVWNFHAWTIVGSATNACGSATSNPATLTICPADINCDSGVDINDLLVFLAAFASGDAIVADLDNGQGQGVRDGGVDINDLLFFLAHFEAGC